MRGRRWWRGASWRENGGGTRRRRKRSRERETRRTETRARYADKDAHTERASEWEDESCSLLPEERHNRAWTGEERRAGGWSTGVRDRAKGGERVVSGAIECERRWRTSEMR